MLPNFYKPALRNKANSRIFSAINRGALAAGIAASLFIMLSGYAPGVPGSTRVPAPISLLMVQETPSVKELGIALLTTLMVDDLSENVSFAK